MFSQNLKKPQWKKVNHQPLLCNFSVVVMEQKNGCRVVYQVHYGKIESVFLCIVWKIWIIFCSVLKQRYDDDTNQKPFMNMFHGRWISRFCDQSKEFSWMRMNFLCKIQLYRDTAIELVSCFRLHFHYAAYGRMNFDTVAHHWNVENQI